MNIKTLIAAAALASISATIAGTAFAQAPAPGTNTPAIDKRDAKLDANIAAAKADGTVTKKERAKLTAEENRNSKVIHHKKHNAKTDAPATAPATK